MPASELALWLAHDSESPIGDDRLDLHAAMIASAVFQAQGAKIKVSEMMPKWAGENEESEADSGVSGDDFFIGLMSRVR